MLQASSVPSHPQLWSPDSSSFPSWPTLQRTKINRSHTHTPTENNTPDTNTHTHTRQEQQPKLPNGLTLDFILLSFESAMLVSRNCMYVCMFVYANARICLHTPVLLRRFRPTRPIYIYI